MAKLTTLKGYLARTETHITEGELRVARQMLRLGRLRAEGRDTLQARLLLDGMEETLRGWQENRVELLVKIALHEAANDP